MYGAVFFLIEEADGLARLELVVAYVVGDRAVDGKYDVVESVAVPIDRFDGIAAARNEGILNFEF